MILDTRCDHGSFTVGVGSPVFFWKLLSDFGTILCIQSGTAKRKPAQRGGWAKTLYSLILVSSLHRDDFAIFQTCIAVPSIIDCLLPTQARSAPILAQVIFFPRNHNQLLFLPSQLLFALNTYYVCCRRVHEWRQSDRSVVRRRAAQHNESSVQSPKPRPKG